MTTLVYILAFMVTVSSAQAVEVVADKAVLSVPYGDWIVGLSQVVVEILKPLALVFFTGLAGKVGGLASMFLTTQRIDRMIQLAADYALNAVEGAAAGRVVSFDVRYQVLKVALERAMGSSPKWLIDAAGGPKGITERLFRTFKFDDKVTDHNTLTPVLSSLGVR